MKLLIPLVTFLLQFFSVSSFDCKWLNNASDCVIECAFGVFPSSLASRVQSVYNSYPDCHPTGVKLILPQAATDQFLQPNWLTANINVTELEMDASIIRTLEANSFSSPIFTRMTKLHLKSFMLSAAIPFDFFNGMNSLEQLVITNSHVPISDNGWLNYVSETFKSLLITGTGRESPTLLMERLTGGSARMLSNVEYVKIQYNLTDSIDRSSFTAIPNVRELDLSNCGITAIGELSFDRQGSNLQILNLERNRLTTLPVGIFSSLSLNPIPTDFQLSDDIVETDSLKILLRENLWDCECTSSMIHLKELLIEYTNFDEGVSCTTPEDLRNYPIKEADLCPIEDTTTTEFAETEIETTEITTTEITTTEITTIETTTIESVTEVADKKNNEKQCPSYNDVHQSKTNVSIQPPMQPVWLNKTSSGVTVSMLNYLPSELILIWFKSEESTYSDTTYYQNAKADDSDCLFDLYNTVHINDLDKKTSYTFCLMNSTQGNVSPLDCISYYNQGEEEASPTVCLYEKDKPLAVSLIVVACIANIIVGIIIGVMFLKLTSHKDFQCWKRSQQKGVDSHLTSDFTSNPSSSRLSIDLPPPLPPHPRRISYEDNVYYATVK